MGYIISYNGELEHGADMHGYMTYGPTIDFNFSGMDIKSASELRATWPEMDDESKAKAAELMYPGNGETASKLLNDALGDPEVPAEGVQEENNILAPLRGAAAELFGEPEVSQIPPEETALLQAMEKYKDDPAGFKDWIKKDVDIRLWLSTDGSYLVNKVKQHMRETTTAEVTPGQTLPKQIKVIKMPTPPQAPTGPDGTGEDGTRIGTTPKGNRSVSSGAGTYIFTPKGELMLYMTPKIGGLQQTHNIKKQTVTINFGSGTVDQKATYDMSGKLLSRDTTSIKSGTMGVSVDKDKGATVDMTTLSGKKHSINSKDPKKYNKLAALKKDQDQDLDDFKKANTATLAKMGIKR